MCIQCSLSPLPELFIQEPADLILIRLGLGVHLVVVQPPPDQALLLLPTRLPLPLDVDVLLPQEGSLLRGLLLLLLLGQSGLFVLALDQGLDPGSGPGVNNVTPVLLGGPGQFDEPLDQEDAGVADLARPVFLEEEATLEAGLIADAVCESGAVTKIEKGENNYYLR